MYYISDLSQLTENRINEIIMSWRTNELCDLELWKNYYDGKQEISRKYVADSTRPCNKILTNYCYDIVNTYAGYLSGIPISYSSIEDISDILDILTENDYHTEDNLLLKNALIYGVSYEVAYLDETANQKIKVLDSREIIPIYKNDLDGELLAVIRLYSANDIEDWSKNYIDIYTDKEIKHYKSDSTFSSSQLISVEPHYFKKVPITIFTLNEERKSIFNQVMSLQDAYNKVASAAVDNVEAFQDAYMILKGLHATPDEVADMKVNRILELDTDSDAYYLTKEDNYSNTQMMLDHIEKMILKISECVDFSDEQSFGASSGIAIKYKLIGFENIASNIEANMRKALNNRLTLIGNILSLTADGFSPSDIEIHFTRNIPVNEMEQAQLINQLRGLVSDETLLAQLPFVTNPADEIVKVKEQETPVTTYDFNLTGE